MIDNSLIEILRQLGFSEYEAKCYLALFKKDSLIVSEVAKLGGVPRPNAYDALEKLMAEGFIVAIPGKTKRYAVSDPKHLIEKSFLPKLNSIEYEIENLEKKKTESSGRKDDLKKNTDSLLRHLEFLYDKNRFNGDPLEYMEVIKHPAQVHRRVLQLLNNARTEMVGFTKPPYSYISESSKKTHIHFNEQIECLNEAVRRGLSMRNIYELPEDKEHLISWYNNVCEGHNPAVEDRAIEKLPLKMAVFDKRFVIYQLEDPVERKPSTTSLITEHPALAEGFAAMFEYYWEKAKDHIDINNRKHSLLKPRKIKINK